MEDNTPDKRDYVLLRHNRRKTLRAQLLVLEVKGEDEKGVFFGYAKDLSKGGMFIATVAPRKVGTEFTINFSIPSGGMAVKSKCRVSWVREYNADSLQGPGMGIKFLNLPLEVKEKIGDWVKTLDVGF